MMDGLPTRDAPATDSTPVDNSPGGVTLSGWMVVQLLLAVCLVPVVDGVALLIRTEGRHVFYLTSFPHFTSLHANILWIVQVGLMLNLVGRAAQHLALRWAAILTATLFLLVQDGIYNYPSGIYLSLAAVAGVWLIWDPSPLGWRMIVGTAVGFALVAAHYVVFARNALAFENTLLVLHYALVIGSLLLLRWGGWRLAVPDSPAAPPGANVSTFGFAHLFLCVTCCGVGLMLLRRIGFDSADVLQINDLTNLGNHELTWGPLVLGLVTPVMCLAAVWATLSQRGAHYWLGLLAIAGGILVGLECLRPYPVIISKPSPGYVHFLNEHIHVLMVATNCLLVMSVPTAILLVYRAAGFRLTRVRK